MLPPAIIVFFCLLLSPAISATEPPQFTVDGTVLELDESNFDAAISTFDYIFVDFYAPWCGHCKRLAPELDKAAAILAEMKQPIVIAKVNADKHRRLGSKYEIDGYPTLKMFVHGVPTDFNGPRKADLLVKFLKKYAAPDVTVLDSDSAVGDFIEKAGSFFPMFIGFGLDQSLISNLAIQYKKKAWFSVAKDFSDETMSLYDFDKVPALLALQPNYNEQSIFYGPFEEKFLEDYINQSLLPLVLPINHDTLRLLKDDKRKIVLTIMEDETDEKSKGLIKNLKAAASANRDLVFAFVGFKQWEEFAESFDVNKKTPLPKMIVWDGDEEYFTVIGSETIGEDDQRSHITQFVGGYREGSVIQKQIKGPSFMGFIHSMIGVGSVTIIVFVVGVVMIIQSLKEEPLRVGTRDQTDSASYSASEPEARETQRVGEKED
ncbi:PREDICTED: protein disulfide-isomerase 5-2 [Ipomoea nil]|uniref:protein disulfide-isomerase 5-2 n=1 Tax=Ipomoea nil TaxID=35883 RepID=UPI000900D843|nr:PREDICTED: protein disulfide-isomerase 5-2 [Ipomoea nil]